MIFKTIFDRRGLHYKIGLHLFFLSQLKKFSGKYRR